MIYLVKMLRGYKKLIILEELKKGKKTGYDLIKRIKELSGKASAGYIYPLLKEYLENGFVNVSEVGRKKYYSLTKKGKELLKKIEDNKREMLKLISKFIEIFPIEDTSNKKEMLAECQKYEKLVLLDADIYEEFHKAKCKLYSSNYNKKREEFRKIMKDTINRIKRLSKEK